MNISPETYKRMAMQHARLKSMKQGKFVQWACSFWQNAYHEGLVAAEGGSDVEVWDENDLLTLDDVRDAMLKVKGIGARRADAVIELLMENERKEER